MFGSMTRAVPSEMTDSLIMQGAGNLTGMVSHKVDLTTDPHSRTRHNTFDNRKDISTHLKIARFPGLFIVIHEEVPAVV